MMLQTIENNNLSERDMLDQLLGNLGKILRIRIA